MSKPYRTLITGGAGFLGSHLCEALIVRGHEVICLDNLLTGREYNIAHLQRNRRFRFLRDDACNHLCLDGPLDAILHFASPASPKDYLQYPILTLRVGALGTLNMLDLAREKKARFLLASTSEVYGNPLVNPQPETYWGNVNPVGPRGVYDEAKRFAEAVTMAYHREYGLDTRVARIFNTYGPRMRPDDGRAVSNFVVQALRNEPLTVYGDGSQTRSFCYLDDMVDGILAVLEHPSDGNQQEAVEPARRRTEGEADDCIHLPINLGNPDERSVLELARLILTIARSESFLRFLPLPVNDPRVRRPDVSRAQRLLNWTPRVDLKEGLVRTVDYFRSVLRATAPDSAAPRR